MSHCGHVIELVLNGTYDRTRRIHFQTDSFAHAEALQPKLSEYLTNKGYYFQCSFISKTMNRITYDLLERSSVDTLLQQPPVIDRQPLFPTTPRYIQPLFGLETAILGMKDVQLALPTINNYITQTYGDVIASSRLALDGDAYCVVFDTWAQTYRFLHDPFTAFESGFGVSHSISNPLPVALTGLLGAGSPPLVPRPLCVNSRKLVSLTPPLRGRTYH